MGETIDKGLEESIEGLRNAVVVIEERIEQYEAEYRKLLKSPMTPNTIAQGDSILTAVGKDKSRLAGRKRMLDVMTGKKVLKPASLDELSSE